VNAKRAAGTWGRVRASSEKIRKSHKEGKGTPIRGAAEKFFRKRSEKKTVPLVLSQEGEEGKQSLTQEK